MLLLDRAPHLPNPNPTRISDAEWRLWCEIVRRIGSARLGGIYANKAGYHNYRAALPANDYSVEDVAADRRGPSNCASAEDISLSDEDMRTVTGRLDHAARARDIRLYTARGPVLREFIGTKDSSTVYCYVLVGGRALGVGADAGPDPGRDSSHLWHVHLSIIREFCNDRVALDGVLSVMIGESLSDYQERLGSVATIDDVYRLLEEGLRAGPSQTSGGGVPIAYLPRQFFEVDNQLSAMAATLAAIAAALPGIDDETLQRLDALRTQVTATPAQVVSLLAAQPAEDAATLVVAAVGDERARALADAILAATGGADSSE